MKIYVNAFRIECDGDGCNEWLRDFGTGDGCGPVLYFEDDEQYTNEMDRQELCDGWSSDGDKAYCKSCADAIFGDDG